MRDGKTALKARWEIRTQPWKTGVGAKQNHCQAEEREELDGKKTGPAEQRQGRPRQESGKRSASPVWGSADPGEGEARAVWLLPWGCLDGGQGRSRKCRGGTWSFCWADCSRSRDSRVKTARMLGIWSQHRPGLRCELRSHLDTHPFVLELLSSSS